MTAIGKDFRRQGFHAASLQRVIYFGGRMGSAIYRNAVQNQIRHVNAACRRRRGIQNHLEFIRAMDVEAGVPREGRRLACAVERQEL